MDLQASLSQQASFLSSNTMSTNSRLQSAWGSSTMAASNTTADTFPPSLQWSSYDGAIAGVSDKSREPLGGSKSDDRRHTWDIRVHSAAEGIDRVASSNGNRNAVGSSRRQDGAGRSNAGSGRGADGKVERWAASSIVRLILNSNDDGLNNSDRSSSNMSERLQMAMSGPRAALDELTSSNSTTRSNPATVRSSVQSSSGSGTPQTSSSRRGEASIGPREAIGSSRVISGAVHRSTAEGRDSHPSSETEGLSPREERTGARAVDNDVEMVLYWADSKSPLLSLPQPMSVNGEEETIDAAMSGGLQRKIPARADGDGSRQPRRKKDYDGAATQQGNREVLPESGLVHLSLGSSGLLLPCK